MAQLKEILEKGRHKSSNTTYISRNCVGRISMKLYNLAMSDTGIWCATLNSYCGLLSHGNNYNLMHMLLRCNEDFGRYGVDIKLRHFYSKEDLKKRVEGNLCKIGEGERDLYF